MNNNHVDLLIIGAGASGACVGYEASKRGLKVALLEAGDIGGGTSSRSTKLLHGGVRYLELAFKTFDLAQLKLVREALLERAYWLEQTPFLANRIELALPTEDCFSKSYYRIGLGLYDILSGRKNIGTSRLLSKSEIEQALPLIRDGLDGGVVYSDGQFNDSRLNLLLALTAKKAGAVIRTRCKVIKLESQADGKLCGAISQDLHGEQERWEAGAVVNATGINVDAVRQLADPNIAPRILVSRGVHLVLKENLCPNETGLILPATDDGRVLFLLPFFGYTQVGTTDTPCNIKTAQKTSDEEQEYLIKYIKRWFPRLKKTTIGSAWAGGRPLLKSTQEGISSSRVVREHEVEIMPCGLISAMGGKWTTCRQIALDTLKAVEAVLGKPLPPPRHLPIIGSRENLKATTTLIVEQKKQLKQYLPKSELQAKQIVHLQSQYGLEALSIVANSSPEELNPLSHIVPICQAEIKHAIHHEFACTPTDILARRCRLAMVDLAEAQRLLPVVNSHLKAEGLNADALDLEQ
ncbi:glycerol-3-phosphate dehydrogenase/oxidase [Prochlorococcus sp. MIT 1307]|uniref:glycerol-3-phosphate dehydrogenase/oxidase n=1 Tax=Prochlorococcus sp. MIT 1307 TaxID=3096219 RepID=UPI002A755799|nr:FAD-dependent oxidoreductase [Prochlorococcus sp. MIT 1307]